MEHKVVFTSDTHGNQTQYAKLVDHVGRTGANTLILGGDIGPRGRSFPDFIQVHRAFLRDRFRRFCEQIKEGNPKINIFVIMGNDDFAVNMEVLREADPELYKVIHGVRARIDDQYEIVGYPYVPLTRASLKDFDKFDVEAYPWQFRQAETDRKGEWNLDAWKSVKLWKEYPPYDEYFEFEHGRLDPNDAEKDSIARDLAKPVFTANPAKTVYVMHAPPYDTKLDHALVGYHVGSVAERMFIDQHQPHVTLHGHVHESVRLSGDFRETIGRTTSLSSGNDPKAAELSLVTFDLAHPEAAQRIVI